MLIEKMKTQFPTQSLIKCLRGETPALSALGNCKRNMFLRFMVEKYNSFGLRGSFVLPVAETDWQLVLP